MSIRKENRTNNPLNCKHYDKQPLSANLVNINYDKNDS